MSAYIVDRETVDTIVTAVVVMSTARGDEHAAMAERHASDLGRRIWGANLAAVARRYPNDKDGERPGPVDFRDADAAGYEWTRTTAAIDPVSVRDAIATLDYQCSELEEWEASPVRGALVTTQRVAERLAAELANAEREALAKVPHVDYDTKQTAAEMRKTLRAVFPGVKFSVRTARFKWIDVSWSDGPAEPEVRPVVERFQSLRSDEPDGGYHAAARELVMVDGVPTELRWSCRGVTVSRSESAQAMLSDR